LRLKEASSLLHHSELSIEAIAEKTGFNDRQHLNLMFRKRFRITPAQFQKNFLKLLAARPGGVGCARML
jgi:transcriptional regulator GlxA family with amidase domain